MHVHMVYAELYKPGAGSILASVQASSELTAWLEEVDIVTADKVLGQIDDGGHQTLLQRTRQEMHAHMYMYMYTWTGSVEPLLAA